VGDDSDAREKRRELTAALRLGKEAFDELIAYDHAIANLFASIASAALLRSAIIGPLVDHSGKILLMRGDDLTRFLRPIFEEAGIGEDSFPPRERFPSGSPRRS